MGSCLSPLLSEIFMSNLEERIVKGRFGEFLIEYKRYVDDIFIVWNGQKEDLTNFLRFVNSLHPKISFTIEEEQNGKLPFLDLLIERLNNKLIFEIYRKPTTTDNVIQYASISPYPYKFASFNSFFYRLFNIALSKEAFAKELNIIKHIAFNNGFPLYLINKLYFKFLNKYRLTYNLLHAKDDKKSFRSLSFFGVYSLKCGDCDAVYIGQSGRKISTRVKEHVALFEKFKNTDVRDTKSAFANHLLASTHHFSPEVGAEILHECPKGKKLDLLERMEITKAKKSPVLVCVNDVFNFEPNLIFNNLI
ncbi:uncharacterized protein LOC126743334 [Anthonomus grandis grandis]|uniref:uncharacterized protein LOC126743334 n=1 Tax=Anthonomus grandis grandis TaxID=2921223 RepID=UPI002165FB3A|nr:uncharacterized protein LOC126743334 [Anthonomus grandis grandis]